METINQASNGIIGVCCFIWCYQICRLLIKRRSDGLPFVATLSLAAGLFFMGGTGRLIMTMFLHNDFIDMVVRAITALIALAATVFITLSVDRALKMKTPRDCDKLQAEKDQALHSLRHSMELLQRK